MIVELQDMIDVKMGIMMDSNKKYEWELFFNECLKGRSIDYCRDVVNILRHIRDENKKNNRVDDYSNFFIENTMKHIINLYNKKKKES